MSVDRYAVAAALAGALWVVACRPPKDPSGDPFATLVARAARGSGLDPVENRIQVLLSSVSRDSSGTPRFREYRYRVGAEYHYPASTVKLPVAVLALERVNELRAYGVTRDTWMRTEPLFPGDSTIDADPSAASGRPSVAHYIKKILLVSDNDAYNRLYEFVGQDRINRRLRDLGFADAEILHRLERPLTHDENARTNGITFLDATGAPLLRLEAQSSPPLAPTRQTFAGQGYIRAGARIDEPFDFSLKNRWPIEHAHRLTRWIFFPESEPPAQRPGLTDDDLRFLRRYMRMAPPESADPAYAASEAWPTMLKYLYYGGRRGAPLRPGLAIANKVGRAYGFSLDAAYFLDAATGVEFVLSAVVYTNANGVLNDDTYEYETRASPFLAALGRAVLDAELRREGRGR